MKKNIFKTLSVLLIILVMFVFNNCEKENLKDADENSYDTCYCADTTILIPLGDTCPCLDTTGLITIVDTCFCEDTIIYISERDTCPCSLESINDTIALEPVLSESWWQIAGIPDMGTYNNASMEPVDFAIWQSGDDKWQLVSCIRKCGPDADTRVLFRWEGDNLNDTLWNEQGMFMVSEPDLGEQEGWIQAPYVVEKDNTYNFFYGGGGQICVAQGQDGKNFDKVIQSNGETKIFVCEEYDRARDIMILKHDNIYYGYYTGSLIRSWPNDTEGAIFCRTSNNLVSWGEEIKVSETQEDGIQYVSSECPHVVYHKGFFYLFKTQEYNPGEQQTTVYRSDDPLNFGVGTKEKMVKTLPIAAPEIFTVDEEFYLAALMPDLDGIRIFSMDWIDGSE